VLIDGGPSPQMLTRELGKRMPFWDRTIELVVLTHPHDDHLSGLVEVLKRYQVERVLYPDLDYDSPLYEEWERLIEEKDIANTAAQAGQEIELGEGVMIRVVNPQTPQLTGTEADIDTDVENNGSLVLRLDAGRVSFLFTADIMWEAEFGLIAQGAELDCTVLKVAHHGSNSSTTADFLEAANPQLAVISVGADNPYGHPGDEVLERLKTSLGEENVFRTDEDGTIEFITDGEELWLVTDE
jgi:competence protein ComEC